MEKHALDLINYSVDSTEELPNPRTEGTVKSTKSAKSNKSARSKQFSNSNFWTQNLSTKFDDQLKISILKSANSKKKNPTHRKKTRSTLHFPIIHLVLLPQSQDGHIKNSLS